MAWRNVARDRGRAILALRRIATCWAGDGRPHHRLVLVSDRTLERSRNTIGAYVSALDVFMREPSRGGVLRDQRAGTVVDRRFLAVRSCLPPLSTRRGATRVPSQARDASPRSRNEPRSRYKTRWPPQPRCSTSLSGWALRRLDEIALAGLAAPARRLIGYTRRRVPRPCSPGPTQRAGTDLH